MATTCCGSTFRTQTRRFSSLSRRDSSIPSGGQSSAPGRGGADRSVVTRWRRRAVDRRSEPRRGGSRASPGETRVSLLADKALRQGGAELIEAWSRDGDDVLWIDVQNPDEEVLEPLL